jgi:hypothetical protein
MLMFLADNAKAFKDDERGKVKTFMYDELYVRHVPIRGEMKYGIPAALPVPTAFTDELFKLVDDFSDAIDMVDVITGLDIIDRVVTDKERKDAIINLFLTTLKFATPNPVTPTIQTLFEKSRRNHARKLKEEGSSNPELEMLKNSMDNIGDIDGLNTDIENMRNAVRDLGIE